MLISLDVNLYRFHQEVLDEVEVEVYLKSRHKVHYFPHVTGEERFNDCSPFLLYIWNVNTDCNIMLEMSAKHLHITLLDIYKAQKESHA